MLRRILAVAVASTFVGLAACHHEQSGPQPVTLSASDKVPAANGSFEALPAGNGNTAIHLSVAHMAPPDKVAAGATTYVVWVQPLASDGQPQNVGALHVDANRRGALDTITPLRSFEVFVTPEASASVQQPSGTPLLWGRAGG